MHERRSLDPQRIGLSTFGKVIAVVRRSRAFVLLLAVCACSSGGPTSPAGTSPKTVYVATTGDDRNDGTIADPWQTLRHAVAQLHAGDTLYVRGGTYTGSANTIDSALGTVRGGTSWSNAITIAGYESETATIRPPQSHAGIGLTTATAQYLIFKDLVIDMIEQVGDNGPNGVYLSGGANHNRFLRLEIRNNSDFGLQFSRNNGNSPFNEVIDCRIHNNGLVGGPMHNGHGLYISTSDNLIEGNDIFDNHGYGLHLYDNEGALHVARNIVRNNRIHNNGRHSGPAYGIVVAWGDANQIYNNVIYGNPGGIQVYTNSSNTSVYNNTIYNNTPLEGILIQYATGAKVTDNIVYGNGVDILDLGSSTTLSNNRAAP